MSAEQRGKSREAKRDPNRDGRTAIPYDRGLTMSDPTLLYPALLGPILFEPALLEPILLEPGIRHFPAAPPLFETRPAPRITIQVANLLE